MRTLITTNIHPASYELAFLLKEDTLLFGSDFNDFPSAESNSLAHELLKFCLDKQVDRIFPLRYHEITAVAESMVLFAEFGIDIMLGQADIMALGITDKQAASFNELSRQLIALGYPNVKIALSDSTNRGEFILVDDAVKNNTQVWGQIRSMNFSQLGKWFNNSNFESISLYKVDGRLKQNYVLIDNYQAHSVSNLNFLTTDLTKKLMQTGAKGFFYIVADDKRILSVRQASI